MCNYNAAALDGYVWYLAIGSMMLPQSYEVRGFHPKQSQAAELLDYRLGFFSCQGFAEAIPSPGDSLHGVMHLVSIEEMRELDKIEAGYIRRLGKARPYGKDCSTTNELVDVTVYCRPEGANKEEENKPPHERYLEILIAGAEHFGVDPNYIQFLKDHDRQPRTFPSQYLSFADPPVGKRFTKFPNQPNDGSLLVCLNGKVIRISYPLDHEHRNFFFNMVQKYGHHFEVGMSQIALDIKLGCIKDMKDCTPELSAYIEDRHYRFMKTNHDIKYYQVIGSYDGKS
ncbi:Gamma-glutamylcyclotransferase [Seminavis robusta]|uniref:gamma-glutamylcyclotransferase n=1 Tax=Seminavis robusta TaxID=568900 RepID=A0A9N8HPM8_9STRA|nr:Gamma-glutamylcyclotransferase [Seminavis robusta]|eukprot:Sro1344_g264740.1 Gamma-glutamylcyclotransferase (284) ;mRNA; r:28005-28856